MKSSSPIKAFIQTRSQLKNVKEKEPYTLKKVTQADVEKANNFTLLKRLMEELKLYCDTSSTMYNREVI